jgi:proteic killer suppression protein
MVTLDVGEVAMSIYQVKISDKAQKDLKKVPSYILDKVFHWIDEVKHQGLSEIRKISSYHDEPLKGKWQGYRSIRLSRAYRAFYTTQADAKVEFAQIERVNKHEY